jgi:16S rRNA (guanine527-N7)-methyltransferase
MTDNKNELMIQLKKGLKNMDLSIDESKQEQLVAFVLLLDKWNKAYNLTSVREPEQMMIKHILDSLAIGPHLNQVKYIDVGTGPGLPGIPLAIVFPEKHFTLLDSLGKRIRFIKQVIFELKLNNINTVQSRVEQFIPDDPYDSVITRAFASIKDMLHWCQHLVDSQGQFLALKGLLPEEEIEQIPEGYSIVDAIELAVPGLEGERHLIKIKKQ